MRLNDERKNIVVFETGDVYTLNKGTTLCDWMEDHALTMNGKITYLQGPVFDHIEHPSNTDADSIDEIRSRLFESDYEDERDAADRFPNGSYNEFLSLLLASNEVSRGLGGVYHDSHQALNEWMMDEHGINEDSPIVTSGIVEIDWDAVSNAYDDDGGVILEGEDVVYELDR